MSVTLTSIKVIKPLELTEQVTTARKPLDNTLP